jgi:hypothetical protein
LATFHHASVIASPSVSWSTALNVTRVHPARPHAPASGENAEGCVSGMQRRKNALVHAEVRMPDVRPLNRALYGQGNAAEVTSFHQRCAV